MAGTSRVSAAIEDTSPPSPSAHDIDHRNGDVVTPGRPDRGGDELIGGIVRLGAIPEDGDDAVLGDLVEEAIAAEQEPVADAGRYEESIDLDLRCDSKCPRENVALRVRQRLISGETVLANEVFYQAVVERELPELVVAQEVRPAVADVDDADLLLGGSEGEGHERGAHPSEVRVCCAFENRSVRLFDQFDEAAGWNRIDDVDELGDRDAGGHLAALVTTHAVGHDAGVATEVNPVLVAVSDVADV